MERELLVRKIENGTVIDHIPAGKGLKVAQILNVGASDFTSVVLLRVQSKKLGRKDIVKIEGRELSEREASRIALIAPDATLNIIRSWDVVEKKKIILPELLEGVVACPNKNCITNSEVISTKFLIEKREPLRLRCVYCERLYTREEVI